MRFGRQFRQNEVSIINYYYYCIDFENCNSIVYIVNFIDFIDLRNVCVSSVAHLGLNEKFFKNLCDVGVFLSGGLDEPVLPVHGHHRLCCLVVHLKRKQNRSLINAFAFPAFTIYHHILINVKLSILDGTNVIRLISSQLKRHRASSLWCFGPLTEPYLKPDWGNNIKFSHSRFLGLYTNITRDLISAAHLYFRGCRLNKK